MNEFTYNEMDFSQADVENGLLDEFIKVLNDLTLSASDTINEIHISYDGYSFILTWAPHYCGDRDQAFVKTPDSNNE